MHVNLGKRGVSPAEATRFVRDGVKVINPFL